MMIERYYTKKINEFLKITDDFCEEHNIKEKTFENFLFYEKNQYCSPAFYFLHLCPNVYLVNSKSFMKYYNLLEDDFKDDIITKSEIREAVLTLKRNKNILLMLKQIQKNDSIR